MSTTKKSYYDKEYHKKYYEQHSDEIKKYRKKIYEENKEDIKKRNLEYYNANKDKLTKTIICKCGGRYARKDKSNHSKTKIHQKYLNTLNNSSNDDTSDSDN